MRKLLLQSALFLGLLLSMSIPGKGAALTNAALQGSYFFTLQKVDTSVLGFSFTTAAGTLAFDGTGRVAALGTINRNGNLQALNAAGTYSLDAAGTVQLSISGLSLNLAGSVSFDLSSFLATNVASSSLQSHEVLIGTKQPASGLAPAQLSGAYFLASRTIRAISVSPQLESSTGTISFDGAGNCALNLTTNRSGSIASGASSGTYRVAPDGTLLLTLAGRADPVTLGFSPGASLGAGTTMTATSKDTYDLFVLTRAASESSANTALGGSYLMVAAGVSTNTGFSTSAGRATYRGDGRVSYQLRQNRMGTAANATGDSTIAVSAGGSLQFAGVPNVAGTFQGGLGSSSHTVVAGALGDPSVYNMMVGIRTPTQPAATSNAASFSSATALSPGALFSLFGTNLARQTVLASSLPLLPQMGGATVRVGGVEAPLHFVSPFQINAQVPFELPPGPAPITVVLDGVESGPLAATVNAAGPGIFTFTSDGAGAGIFLHGDFSLVTASNPAHPGEVILIYGTGLGAVSPPVASGAGGPSAPLARASASVSVQIGGRDAEVSFAGLAPDFVGLYQINVRVPPDLAPAPNVPVVVTAGGVPSNTVTLPVAP